AEKNFHYVVNCGHTVMKNHCYWPLVSDLNNVLTHRPVALEFLSDPGLLDMWLSLLCMFQGMNVNQRELSQHVEFEPNTYYAAFSAELEGSATPMWALISHLKSPEQLGLTKQVISHCLIALEDWFDAIGFSTSDKVSYLLYLVAFHEILSNMWVRNGLQIKGQAMTYIQCHFCNSMVDADIVLLQICATHLDPDWFLKTVMQRFHVWEWLSFHPSRTNTFLDAEQVMPMLEGALTLLTMLMSIRTNIGMSEEEVTRQEMVSLLCMSDRTHSQLMDLLPENSGMTSQNRDFESILNKVADYKAPNFEAGGTMLQGMYMPKPEIWKNEYDPIHVLLRAVHRRDYQSSLDRYSQFARQNGKYVSLESPWPPFRIPSNTHKEFLDPVKFLQSKTMHAIIFTILYRACHDPDIPDQVIALTVYLLEAAIHFSSPVYSKKESLSSLIQMHEEVPDLNYKEWFPYNCIIDNIALNIQSVIAADKPELSVRIVEVMEVDEDEEEIMELTDENATYHVQSPINEEEGGENIIQHPQLPSSNVPLALPPSSVPGTLVPVSNNATTSNTVMLRTTVPVTAQMMIAPALPSITSETNNDSMAIVPTAIRPQCIKLKRFFGRSNGLNSQGSSDHQNYPDGSLKALPSAGYNKIEVNESILSLLLKLHSKLSRKSDSYIPLSKRTANMIDPNEKESRIGDGPFFIGKVLDRLTELNSQIETNIQQICQRLWPKKEKLEDPSKSPKEIQDKEDRRRRAKERQQKLMAEFASRQKAFMQKTMETESEAANSKEKEKQETILTIEREYECVICGQTTPSEEERPVGMVVLLQATSVLGHMQQEDIMLRNLPCNDEERLQLKKEGSLALYMEQLIEEFNKHFDNTLWQMSLNIGWEGGVHVQSCGHYLHLDCHKSYMQSLKSQSQQTQRHQNLAVDRGEYSCPLCRQLANSVLPINPQMGEMAAVVRCYPNTLKAVAAELSQVLSVIPTPIPSILKSMAGILEDLSNSTYPQFRSVGSAPNPQYLLLFVCSIARTNLEIELLQRVGNFSSLAIKKSCFVPLFHVLALYTKVLVQTPYAQLWSQLTGMSLDGQNSSLAHIEREVPLFLRDVVALLLQITLTLPLNLDKGKSSLKIIII
ncbi:E3 ubiquitin-protein ligase ubr3-like, partial [Centruroides sculpturatus]|uniref:E3 ubiquitin-protein ligase ubr3-like n=1 Tax=Centruroides sculpturatus TaxID=218467 RepID=UPI000C6CB8DA